MTNASRLLTIEEILNAPDLPPDEVSIPAWGDKPIAVYGLSGSEHEQAVKDADGADIRPWIVAANLRISVEQARELLAKKRLSDLALLWGAINRANGWAPDDEQEDEG